MKISPISFKGTFCIRQEDLTTKKIDKLLAKRDELHINVDASSFISPDNFYLHLPHKFDAKLMKALEKLSIPYVRVSESESLSPEGIVSRMILNPDVEESGKFLQPIDTERLDEELKKAKERYVGINGENGSELRYERFKMFLRTNQEIKSPVIYLEKIPNGNVVTHIYDGRHRFAVLRDMGIKRIPVTIDKKSMALAKEIGLIK